MILNNNHPDHINQLLIQLTEPKMKLFAQIVTSTPANYVRVESINLHLPLGFQINIRQLYAINSVDASRLLLNTDAAIDSKVIQLNIIYGDAQCIGRMKYKGSVEFAVTVAFAILLRIYFNQECSTWLEIRQYKRSISFWPKKKYE